MLLSIDIGNTNITLGVYENDNLVKTFRIVTDKKLPVNDYELMLTEMLKDYKISDCVIGSVVLGLDTVLKQACDNIFNLDTYILNNSQQKAIKIALANPSEVGADRIANACAVKTTYKLPAIIIDIGTAITFDIVNRNGEFIGGIIMPGINTQFESLKLTTSKLPKITADKIEKAIGDCTKNAILSGVIRGTACAIDGLIYQCESELGETSTLIATGGLCDLVIEHMSRKFDYTVPDLTLKGLKNVYYKRM